MSAPKKKNTKHSSVLLLRLVFFFSEQTLEHFSEYWKVGIIFERFFKLILEASLLQLLDSNITQNEKKKYWDLETYRKNPLCIENQFARNGKLCSLMLISFFAM